MGAPEFAAINGCASVDKMSFEAKEPLAGLKIIPKKKGARGARITGENPSATGRYVPSEGIISAVVSLSFLLICPRKERGFLPSGCVSQIPARKPLVANGKTKSQSKTAAIMGSVSYRTRIRDHNVITNEFR